MEDEREGSLAIFDASVLPTRHQVSVDSTWVANGAGNIPRFAKLVKRIIEFRQTIFLDLPIKRTLTDP